MRPFPIYQGRLVYWDIQLPDGSFFGIRFRDYSRAADLVWP
jgi:hypothetical protein